MRKDNKEILEFIKVVAICLGVVLVFGGFYYILETKAEIDSALINLDYRLDDLQRQADELLQELEELNNEVEAAWTTYIMLKYGNITFGGE